MDKKIPHWNTILSQKNFWFVYFRLWDKNAVKWEYTNKFGWTNKTDISKRKKNEVGEKIQKFLQICKNSLHSQT